MLSRFSTIYTVRAQPRRSTSIAQIPAYLFFSLVLANEGYVTVMTAGVVKNVLCSRSTFYQCQRVEAVFVLELFGLCRFGVHRVHCECFCHDNSQHTDTMGRFVLHHKQNTALLLPGILQHTRKKKHTHLRLEIATLTRCQVVPGVGKSRLSPFDLRFNIPPREPVFWRGQLSHGHVLC